MGDLINAIKLEYFLIESDSLWSVNVMVSAVEPGRVKDRKISKTPKFNICIEHP
jgi:hypothetical protein